MSMTEHQAKQLGALIARERKGHGLSVRILAKELGVDPSWVTYLEQGRFLDPAPERLARVAEALSIKPGRVDRLTEGAVSNGMPSLSTYFRAKYNLAPEQVAKIEAYVDRLRR